MKSIVYNIQRMSLHDGPGIRTIVFLKGCPLDCKWCHNPESKNPKPILLFDINKCIGCKKCSTVCNLHKFDKDYNHYIDREKCILCGKCVDECVGALEICGKEMSIDEIVEEVKKDKDFYNNSNGGVTISGGEPLMHKDFLLNLLKKLKENNINVCIETSGYSNFELIEEINEYIDIFLYDIKETNNKNHIEYTKVSNELIMENLYKLNDLNSKIILRCPIIPNVNNNHNHYKNIANIANDLDNIIQIDLEPYHPLGISKCTLIGEKSSFNYQEFLDKKEILIAKEIIEKHTIKPVFII
jgi:pyruvate formate lyase activating enzyme